MNSKPLPEAWRREAVDWIENNIRPAATVCNSTSYGIKARLDHDTGIYTTTLEFNDLMAECGYYPVKIVGRPDQAHHYYMIRILNERRRFNTPTKMGEKGSYLR